MFWTRGSYRMAAARSGDYGRSEWENSMNAVFDPGVDAPGERWFTADAHCPAGLSKQPVAGTENDNRLRSESSLGSVSDRCRCDT